MKVTRQAYQQLESPDANLRLDVDARVRRARCVAAYHLAAGDTCAACISTACARRHSAPGTHHRVVRGGRGLIQEL